MSLQKKQVELLGNSLWKRKTPGSVTLNHVTECGVKEAETEECVSKKNV